MHLHSCARSFVVVAPVSGGQRIRQRPEPASSPIRALNDSPTAQPAPPWATLALDLALCYSGGVLLRQGLWAFQRGQGGRHQALKPKNLRDQPFVCFQAKPRALHLLTSLCHNTTHPQHLRLSPEYARLYSLRCRFSLPVSHLFLSSFSARCTLCRGHPTGHCTIATFLPSPHT